MPPALRPRAAPRLLGLALAATTALIPAGATGQVPTAPTGTKLAPTDVAPGDLFACALAADGSLAVGGSLLDDDLGSASGSLYVFTRTAQGSWSQTAKLLAADGRAGDQLGFSVALSDGRAIAGAPFRNETGPTSGAVYVFGSAVGSGGWDQEAKLVPTGLGARDELGRAVAVSGSTVAGGAPGDDDRGSSAGAVYVFDLAAGTVDKLTADDGTAGALFGFSLALDGDRLLVGAPFADPAGAQSGAVYVFERQAGGWAQTARLSPPAGAAGAQFGTSVALSGSRAAVGARRDGGAGPSSGAVYLFSGGGADWGLEARLTPTGLAPGDELGISVALAGDALVAGARFAAAAGVGDAGVAWLFERIDGVWTERHRLVSPTPGTGDELGFAVGFGGPPEGGLDVLAGAYRDDDGGADSGTICVFEEAVGPSPPQPPPPGPPPPGPPPPSPPLSADLSVTKDDGATEVAAAGTTTYVITAANAGPDPALGATVSDDFPAVLDCDWSCAANGGAACGAPSGSGDLAETVGLPAGGNVVYTAVCAIDPAATGTLENTAAVTPPAGVTDPVAGNEAATDVDTLLPPPPMPPPAADLAVAKIVEPDQVAPGGDLVYTVTVTNLGPDPAPDARVTDAFPAGLACDWTCAASGGGQCGAGSGSGDLDQSVTLPVGGAVTYTASCAVGLTVQGTLVNTASAAVPAGVEDPVPDNDSATAEVVVEPMQALLSLAKSDGVGTATAGEVLVYDLLVSNAGPEPAVGARLVDRIPANLLAASWSCDNGVAGGGDLDVSLDLPAGGSVACQVTATLAPGFCGRMLNSASVTPPAGTVDPEPGDDTAVDETLVFPQPPQACTSKRLTTGPHAPGATVIYEVLLLNSGPPLPDGMADEFVDPLPPELDLVSATADAGSIVPVDPVLWNGPLLTGDPVTIVIEAVLVGGNPGDVVANQGTLFDDNGVLIDVTDDPTTPVLDDPTEFVIAGVLEIPTLGLLGLGLLAAILLAAGWCRLWASRHRR